MIRTLVLALRVASIQRAPGEPLRDLGNTAKERRITVLFDTETLVLPPDASIEKLRDAVIEAIRQTEGMDVL